MEEQQGNQFDVTVHNVPRVFDQLKIDEIKMKDLNAANRTYRKCVTSNCPPPIDTKTQRRLLMIRRKKYIKFTTPRLQDQKLSKVWKKVGRSHRIKNLEKDLRELRIRIVVAESKVHVTEQERNFKIIIGTIKEIESMDTEINQANLEINHIKSQIERVNQKKVELGRETESEDQYSDHWRKANLQLEAMEGRVQTARQRECILTTENRELRELIANMLFDRKVFNAYWSTLVNNLKDRRKFLLDMIERSNQAYNQGADILDNLKSMESRRNSTRDYHVSEMYKMQGQIDANQTVSKFLGGKGKKREMAPLEPREIQRREDFRSEYSERLNLYGGIVANIKKFWDTNKIEKAKDLTVLEEYKGFCYFKFINELSFNIEKFSSSYKKQSEQVEKDYKANKNDYYGQRVAELNKKFGEEVEKSVKAKDDLEKYKKAMRQYFDKMLEIMKILKCNFKPVEPLLGDHKKITIFNISEFFAILEHRLNEVLALVYCSQRKNRGILDDDPRLLVKSVRRDESDPMQVDDVIFTQQCAECAEGTGVNRYDEEIVFPLDHQTIVANMRNITEAPEIAFRLHNLSKCNLPRSVIVASRRDAQ